jgi:vacuolar protein sorting-associated protein 13A/C
MQPELRTSSSGAKAWSTIDLVVSMNVFKLHLYDADTTSEEDRKDHGVARFALNGSNLRYKMLSNGASESQVVLKSFTMGNTRPGRTVFREIIPAANHDRNQFMVLFTMSGKPGDAALAIVTIDAPQFIFSMDPVFALVEFFTNLPSQASSPNAITPSSAQAPTTQAESSPFRLNYRVDLHDFSIRILEDDTKQDTRAISLSIKQVLASQQVYFELLCVCFYADTIIGHYGRICREPRDVAATNGQGL